MTVKIGIIGIGQQGSMYASVMKNGKFMGMDTGTVEGLELAAVCDISEERKAWAEKEIADVPFFTNHIEMLDSGLIDAVLVVTPHYFHPVMAMDAMDRDIHVLCDKPAGVYTKKVKEMNEMAASKPHLKFAMMFNQRMNPLYLKLKELMDSDVIGSIRRTNWLITTWWRPEGYYQMSDWRATWEGEGGGVLINQAPHQIDLWQWLCGMPTKVTAKAAYGSHRNIAVEDDVTALVEYENGATGAFITCVHDLAGTDRFEILGDKGKIIVEDSKKIILKKLNDTEQNISNNLSFEDMKRLFMGGGLGDVISEEVFEFDNVWGLQHFDVLKNFAAAVSDGAELVAPGAEGIKALSITNAMHLSSWLGEEVSLPIDEDLYFEKLQEKIEEEKIAKAQEA
ncbi:gfo/Idh/MocA family oxidoreductase [Photobacterium rosenbergii]|uniref:Gfo/Idh/MocA family oxidoreductase n=1 Tax=Photobacterium rosenbergii TaxID=294936 RepID=A0A2T3NDM2_9GAMM|nr:Gfo/Idh/MocA family oxidoreductase [Photobacterium rosenbergii]PSW12336.1 gfo/Idh/MocA family oxidoreductase [Photobacterium rosenbergii]